MMHLGVAMGIPTFGIFGITSPQREAIPAENMFPITKGLPCEPACRQRPWGQRDCASHLECLQSLTAQEVVQRLRQVLPAPPAPADVCTLTERQTMDHLTLAYYGYVFDASGYGQAARAYIHALHRAGVTLSVIELAPRARQVHDALVASLVGRPITPDLHLFHGIPPEWAHLAFRLPNAIGMTVWETDAMPTQWRTILSHVLEVWLPSAFNVAVFREALDTPIFHLPHPLLPPHGDAPAAEGPPVLPISAGDFVFYSIFEWQERKGPLELLEAYVRAFPTETDTLLLIKTNPGAVSVARQAVAHVRQQVRSEARIAMCCAAWSEAHMAALQARGDCYVSLHRGEGWGYPLFEAASRGTPVIATGYAGPLDYLQPRAHQLVRYELRPVRQPYVYYHPRMRWAEPDVAQAAEQMRWVYAHRAAARAQAAAATPSLQHAYALEAVGALARERLFQVRQRIQPHAGARVGGRAPALALRPGIPIPAAWYDADYFEHGVKSNWEGGYTWAGFAGLFRETAAFLSRVVSQRPLRIWISGAPKGFSCARCMS